MIGTGERADALGYRGRLRSVWQLKAALLNAEVRVGSADLVRLGMIMLALALQTLVTFIPGHFRPADNAFFAILVPAATLGSLVLSVAATLPLRNWLGPRARRRLAVMGLAAVGVLAIVGSARTISGAQLMVEGTPYGNDGAAMDLYAALQVIHGHNPYVKTSIVPALANIDAPATTTTPLMAGQFADLRDYPSNVAIQQVFLDDLRYHSRRGMPIPQEFESKYNYPSGSFLFILPFAWLGIHDMRILYALAIALMGLYLWRRMAAGLRFLTPLVVLADVPLVGNIGGGQPDPIYGLFLLLGYAEWTSPWLSPLFLGLAVGTKQLAWFAVPIYCVVVARAFGWREVARRLRCIGIVALAMNLPFILESPPSYLASITAPMADPMFPLGIGLIAVFVAHVLPLLPKVAFSTMEVLSWLGATTVMQRFRTLPPAAGIALAALPLFFAWRSLVNYFYLVPLLTLAVALADARRDERTYRVASPR